MSSPRDFRSKWTWLLDRYGLPVMLLFILGTSAYRTAIWATPLAEKVVTKHVEFLEKTTEVQVELSKSSEKSTQILDELRSENRGNVEMIRDIHGVVVKGRRPADVAVGAAGGGVEGQN